MTQPMLDQADQLQRAVQEALFAAESARRSREEFLARMSHELRTPLNAVIGFSRVLESNKPGNQRPEDLEMLRRVRANGEQLLQLIEHVLEQAEVVDGSLSLLLEDIDVAELTERTVNAHRNAAAAKGVSVIAVLPAHAPGVRLDSRRFAQVLGHLLDNAIKFTAAGNIRVVLVTDVATGAPLRLTVTDTGIGIPADRLDDIFEPFAQVDQGAARAHGGSGLGLPLARRLCHAMGCQLVAESWQGRGSRFTISFPRAS